MKRFILLLVILILPLSPGAAWGADALYRMLHADEVESFKKDQDAVIVGQITAKQNNLFSVKVLKVISGEVIADNIALADNFSYGWGETKPALGDFAVMSIKRSSGQYQKVWGIFKADSGDYQTLRLVDNNFKGAGFGDLACIQWYVNSGGTEKDFSFENGNAYVRRPNGQVIQIYGYPEKLPLKAYSSENPVSKTETIPAADPIAKPFSILVMLAANLISVIIAVLYLKSRRFS